MKEVNEFVCLSCLNIIRSVKDKDVRCSDDSCQSRRTVKIEDLKKAVEKMDELPFPVGDLGKFPRLSDFPGPILSLVNKPKEQAFQGVDLLRILVIIRREWENLDLKRDKFKEAIRNAQSRIQ